MARPTPPVSSRRPLLVSDFDGTMTGPEFFGLLLEELDDPSLEETWQAFCDGRLTHFEVLHRIFAAARLDLPAMQAIVEHLEPRAGLAPAVRALEGAGWEVQVASAGCVWYIERFLAAQGLELTVHANPGRFVPGEGLHMELPESSPYLDPATGISKTAVVRAALTARPVVAFAGDGRPDLDAALLVPPARRFARGWLGGALDERGEGCQRFESWSTIAATLLATVGAGDGRPDSQPDSRPAGR